MSTPGAIHPKPALEWHDLIGEAKAAVAADHDIVVERRRRSGPDSLAWHISRTGIDGAVGGFPNALVAEGTADTVADGMAQATAAAERLGLVLPMTTLVMTPAEAEAYLAEHPEFAARVAERARELAERHGLAVKPDHGALPSAPPGESSGSGLVGRAFPDAGPARRRPTSAEQSGLPPDAGQARRGR